MGQLSKDRQVCEMKGKKFSVKAGRDRMGTMFHRQEEFMKAVGLDLVSMPPVERERLIKECCLADIVESVELLNEVNWKPWKRTKKPLDLEQARFEVVDKLCFLLEMAMALGMDAETLFQYHSRKVEINHERQTDGY